MAFVMVATLFDFGWKARGRNRMAFGTIATAIRTNVMAFQAGMIAFRAVSMTFFIYEMAFGGNWMSRFCNARPFIAGEMSFGSGATAK